MTFFRLTACIICLFATSAAADVVVDQEYTARALSYILDYPGDYMAQTFTLRNTGQITSVALQLFARNHDPNQSYFTDDLHFMLTRTNSAGEPVLSQVLATYDIGPDPLPNDFSGGLPMTELDLRDQNAHARAGDVLALVLTSNHTYYSPENVPQYHWDISFNDGIPGGRFYLYSPNVFGPFWFYQWRTDNPNIWIDAGYRITVDPVPEPSTIACAGMLLAVFGFCRRSQ